MMGLFLGPLTPIALLLVPLAVIGLVIYGILKLLG